MQSPCYNCERRHPNCHSECEEYAEFARERAEINAKKHEESRLLYDNEIVKGRSKAWKRKLKKK